VTDVTVQGSSGSHILDAAAQALLRDAKVPSPQMNQDRVTVSIHVDYVLTD
jgi:TonB family protein